MKTFIYTILIISFSIPVQAQNLEGMSLAELDKFASVLSKEGKYSEALPYAKKSVAMSKGIDSTYANSLNTLADLYSNMGDYEQAVSFHLEAIKSYEKAYGKDHKLYAGVLNNLGNVYQYLGRYEQAEKVFLEALLFYAKNKKKGDVTYGIFLNNIATLYYRMGRYEETEQLYHEMIVAIEEAVGKEHEYYATGLQNLGGLFWRLGSYEQAEPLFLESIEIYGIILGKEHPYYATCIHNLATLYQSMELYGRAEPLLMEALKIRAKTLGKNHEYYATSLANLASFYQDTKRYKEAELLYIEAINIIQKNFGENHESYITSLLSLANLYRNTKRYDESEALYLDALDITQKTLGKEHPSYVNVLIELSGLYWEVGKLDAAFSYCMQSISANSNQIDSVLTDFSTFDKYDYYVNDDINRSLVTLLDIIKKQYFKNNNKEKLQQYYTTVQSAMRMNEHIKNEFEGEENKLRALKYNSTLIKSAVESVVLLNDSKYYSEAFGFAEQNKSILLADALKANRARSLGDLPDSLALLEISLQEQYDELKKNESEATSEEEKKIILTQKNDLNLKLKKFKEGIKGKFPKYHAIKYEDISAKVSDIQGLLDEKTAFLEYFLTDSLIYLFVVHQKEIQLFTLGVYRKELTKQIATLRDALTNYEMIKNDDKKSYKNYTQSAFWFYNNILNVALKNKNISHLVIVTDGELGHLPFEAFLTKEAPQSGDYTNLDYLVKQYNISYSYSAALWKENLTAEKRNNNGQFFAFAADYNKKVDLQNRNRAPHLLHLRNALNDLPAAKTEVAGLSELFRGVFLQDSAANEAYFKANVSNYGIIHLAMHGILNKHTPILSSLAFTEDNHLPEDNFLEAWEIAHLKLNADLVVLSACETGYGKFEQGEGVLSLARSFMYAGVPSLVVSLWQVNDQATAVVMKAFYQNLADGLDKAEALQKAKLNYINNAAGLAAHPAFWSPFIQIGDSRPITVETQFIASKTWWVWAIGIGFLVIIIFAFLKRKQKEE